MDIFGKTGVTLLNSLSAGPDELARLSAEINATVENIGARRLHTVLERLLEEISFDASDKPGSSVTVDVDMVKERVGVLSKNADLSKFIL
jgi:ATP-dependent HslUV protease ATP-binding subunit HslU